MGINPITALYLLQINKEFTKQMIKSIAFFATVVLLSCKPMNNIGIQTNLLGGDIKSFHDLTAKDIDGKEYKMSQLKGKKVLVVNVASHCGYTPQYAQLQELYDKYKDKNFIILGFPCNQFMGQEPGSNAEILDFCQKNYGVSFPLFDKVDVKGADISPVYQFLTKKALNGVEDSEVSWNFNKYLIDENGNYVKHFKSGVEPMDAQITNWIEGK
jgi:glutathione peroxidase